MKAKNFQLKDQSGQEHNLTDYRGKWVLLYFYPKDGTPGCTKEACEFRDNFSELTKNNLVIFGISADSVISHEKFAKKHNLPFPLLSDEFKETCKAYEALGEKNFFGKKIQLVKRISVLIDPDGEIVKRYEKVNPLFHTKQVLEDLQIFQESK
jgi:peroxiredoxin Q/BCP